MLQFPDFLRDPGDRWSGPNAHENVASEDPARAGRVSRIGVVRAGELQRGAERAVRDIGLLCDVAVDDAGGERDEWRDLEEVLSGTRIAATVVVDVQIQIRFSQ